jgi:hypothetical protein
VLVTELEGLVSRLGNLGRTVGALLLPGVSTEHVVEVTGGPVPSEVAEWFQWCGGVAVRPGQIQDEVNVIPGYGPLSVEEAVRLKENYVGDSVLGENWVPLLGGAGGDLYAAVWEDGTVVRVAGVLVGESTEIEFSSVEQMVTVFNACYDNGAYFVNGSNMLDMNPDLYDAVYEEIVGAED